MVDINKVTNAIWEVECSIRYFEFAIRLDNYLMNKHKTRSLDEIINEISLPHSCVISGDHIKFDKPMSEKDILLYSSITISNALGISSQVINNAYEHAEIDVKENPNNNSEAIRLYIYNIRNLFQHSIGSPEWNIWPRKCKNINITLNGRSVVIDFGSLNRTKFEYKQIGGINFWFNALLFAINDIKTHCGI